MAIIVCYWKHDIWPAFGLYYCRCNGSVDKILHEFIFLKLINNSYEFKFLFTSCAFPIGQSVLKRNLIGWSESNRKLINFLSNELINLRKGIGAIFYQHFHCIDSNSVITVDWLPCFYKRTYEVEKDNFYHLFKVLLYFSITYNSLIYVILNTNSNLIVLTQHI
jgi:hypothetical protein